MRFHQDAARAVRCNARRRSRLNVDARHEREQSGPVGQLLGLILQPTGRFRLRPVRERWLRLAERQVLVGGEAAGMRAAAAATPRRPGLDVVVLERRADASCAAWGIPYRYGGLFGDPERLVVRSSGEFRPAGSALGER